MSEIENMIKLSKESKDLNILITSFEEFKQDEIAYFDKILKFYEIPKDRWVYKPAVKESFEETKFRKGLVDEWKTSIPPSILKYMDQTNPIPANWKELLGWD
jgi:hypothetical protein